MRRAPGRSEAAGVRGPERSAALACIPACLFLACATPAALEAPHVSSEEHREAVDDVGSSMLMDLVGHWKRMIEIEYRLTRLTAPQCGEFSRPHAGVLLATRDSFDQRKIRAVASDVLAGSDRPTIVYVVPDGPADRAGLREGDQLLALDGEPVDSTTDFAAFMLSSGTRKSARVAIRRENEPEFVANIALESTCPIRLRLTTSALIVPWQTDRLLISIPLGLVRTLPDESTLAVAVAHQIAHTLFDKPDDDALTAEMRADRNGLRLAAKAGYDIGGAVAYWENVAMEYPSLIARAPSTWRPLAWEQNEQLLETQMAHPEIGRRLESIRAIVRAEPSDGSTSTSVP